MNHSGRNKVFSSSDEIVTVKSDLLLLGQALEAPATAGRLKKPRCPLFQVKRNRPSFHIDPEVNKAGCWQRSIWIKSCLVFGKILSLFCFLYIFVASLNLLAASFRLVGGRTAGQIFQQTELLANPIVGVMIGVLVTVIVQSSSTSSSIIVSMVAANFLDVQTAIPIIMGANIGTSVTNTLVSLGQINEREQFERAFAGATVHDMFNWLSVLVLLPLELATGYLFKFSRTILSGINFEQRDVQIELLSKVTKPLIKRIVQIDKDVLAGWSINNISYANLTLHKRYCDWYNETEPILCSHLTAQLNLGDLGIGLILLAASLICLCLCLVCIVRILSSLLKGSVADVVERIVNADFPYVPWLTGYIAILFGALMTFLLQSSSIFTSSLTPLVGLGIITVKRVYPLTIGSNLGTTTTALLAALATEGDRLHAAIQIALVHLFFNISGMLVFYPIPFMRFPIGMAMTLGRTTANYRWFAGFYIICSFILMPAFVFGISTAGSIAMYCTFIPIAVISFCVLAINVFQRKCPKYLPKILHNWQWLPRPLRSLEPLDRVFHRIFFCGKRNKTNT